MAQTSFGTLDILLRGKQNGRTKPLIEHLVFESEGRAHKHNEFETFVVLSGEGRVFIDETFVSVRPGSCVSIKPGQKHWMEPNEGQKLEGFLWYHAEKLDFPAT